MVKINNHIKNIFKEKIKNDNPKIRLYQKAKNGKNYSYDYVNNEGFIGSKTFKDFEREVTDNSYKGITIIMNE